MRIAFLNLCHTDAEIVARVASRITAHPDFDMYIHLDAKTDAAPFNAALENYGRASIIDIRHRVYWGGFNSIKATIDMLRTALAAPRDYEYFMLLQNLDYPLCSNRDIEEFFIKRRGTEFIRACDISKTNDWHFTRKYRIYNRRDDDFYLKKHSKPRMYIHYLWQFIMSFKLLGWNGVIHEGAEEFPIYYGAAQWAITRACAEYIVEFYDTHPAFNSQMAHIQFPDEEYFHTIVHNSPFKYKCVRYDEPVRRWLINWRNLHYFEYPKEITVLTEKDFARLMAQEDILFARKVRTGISDALMDMLDAAADGEQ